MNYAGQPESASHTAQARRRRWAQKVHRNNSWSHDMDFAKKIHWKFEAMGAPDKTEIGMGPYKAMISALIHWSASAPMYRRFRITVAKTQEELEDRRTTNRNQTPDDVDAEFAAMLADVMAGGQEIE
jgi:hypothetical protein